MTASTTNDDVINQESPEHELAATSTRPYVSGDVTTTRPSESDRRLLLACLFASGFTGLVYEVLWTRWFGLVFVGAKLPAR